MKTSDDLEAIYQADRRFKSECEAVEYVSLTVSFNMHRLLEEGNFSAENLAKRLSEEAEFHKNLKSEDVA